MHQLVVIVCFHPATESAIESAAFNPAGNRHLTNKCMMRIIHLRVYEPLSTYTETEVDSHAGA
jgi:hypothetical protein